MQYKDLIHEIMKAKNLKTRQQVADELHVTRQAVSKVLDGQMRFSADIDRHIADALKMNGYQIACLSMADRANDRKNKVYWMELSEKAAKIEAG